MQARLRLARRRTPGIRLQIPLCRNTLTIGIRIGELNSRSDLSELLTTLASVSDVLKLSQTSAKMSPLLLLVWMTKAIWRARKTRVKKAKVTNSLGESFLAPQKPERATKKTTPPTAMRTTLRKLIIISVYCGKRLVVNNSTSITRQ